jgi:hypothetical protein
MLAKKHIIFFKRIIEIVKEFVSILHPNFVKKILNSFISILQEFYQKLDKGYNFLKTFIRILQLFV